MGRGIADIAGLSDDTFDMKVMNVEYTEQGSVPITHLFGRTSNGEWRHIEVEGHRPSFFIHESEYDARVENHYAVYRTETRGADGQRYTNLHGEPLVRVYTHLPGQVAEMRELFEWTGEADVFYTTRFLIDNRIYTGVRVDTSEADVGKDWLQGEMRVDQSALTALDLEETPQVDPRLSIVDIEVAGEEGVPDTDKAEYPISTIVAYDSYDDEYVGWILNPFEHGGVAIENATTLMEEAELDDARRFNDESEMLADFHGWLSRRRPDIITGWYSNDFDIPYLINRSREINAWSFKDWSPLGEVFESKYEPVVKGVSTVDMLDGYKKIQYRKLTDKRLDAVAEKELGERKEKLDRSHTEMWKREPAAFLKYNKKDVELVKRINEAATDEGIIGVLDNLRAVTGVSYSDPIGGNIDMMDTLFLRKAAERGLALPTATKPEVGYYHGAYVYTPEPGLHDNIVYPDFSSLYPNIMYQCNISPETLIGGEDEVEASDYTEDDVVWTWYDPHTPPHIKEDEEADESKMEKLYFVKPSIKEGFIRSVLDDIMGLADEYTGGLYEAVKRVRNSSYGVLGDSDSYGRGFRLFDWRLAEGTTLGGQKMLKKGAEMFAERIDDEDARVIYGDTDSVVTTVPNAESDEDALSKAISAADDVSADLNEYAKEIFGLESVEDARMDLEIESYASSIFFKAQDDGRSTDGVKKRYVQNVVWDDDDMWKDEPELIIKGFEYVRSDVSAITKDVQKKAFEALMENSADEARDIVVKYTKQKVVELMEGDMDANEFGIPFGISQALTKYGARDRRPQPQYRGAKYANQEIYGGSAIGPGDKPLYFYIQEGKVANGMRKTYGAETAEDGQYVDAISVLDAEDLPEGVMIDRRKMVQKTIIRPMEAIFRTLGWDIEQLERAADRATPPEHHRDEGQTGFEAYEAM